MARSTGGVLFTEIAGKTVASIRYDENPDWQALEVLFTDGPCFHSSSARESTWMLATWSSAAEIPRSSGSMGTFQAISAIRRDQVTASRN